MGQERGALAGLFAIEAVGVCALDDGRARESCVTAIEAAETTPPSSFTVRIRASRRANTPDSGGSLQDDDVQEHTAKLR